MYDFSIPHSRPAVVQIFKLEIMSIYQFLYPLLPIAVIPYGIYAVLFILVAGAPVCTTVWCIKGSLQNLFSKLGLSTPVFLHLKTKEKSFIIQTKVITFFVSTYWNLAHSNNLIFHLNYNRPSWSEIIQRSCGLLSDILKKALKVRSLLDCYWNLMYTQSKIQTIICAKGQFLIRTNYTQK